MTDYRVILKKQYASDNFGKIGLQYFDGKGNKKVVSLKISILEKDFKANYSRDFQKFLVKKGTPYKEINSKILDAWNKISNPTGPEEHSVSLIEAIESDIDLQTVQNTINVRQSTLQKVKDFLSSKNLQDIKLKEIDNAFIVGFANFVRRSCKGSTTKTYCDVLKKILNHQKMEGNYDDRYNYFKNIDYNIQKTPNSALSAEFVQKLINIEDTYKYYDVVQMFLLSIFLHGIRFSDLIFLKFENFGIDRIIYNMMKTNMTMVVKYDDKLVSLLARALNIDINTDNAYKNLIFDDILDNKYNLNNRNAIYGGTEVLLENFRLKNPQNFLFEKFLVNEPELLNYNKNFRMTKLQRAAYLRVIVKYIHILKKVAKDYNIDRLSSHSARYTFANLNLAGPNPDLLAVSRALGHKNIQTTQIYFNENFGRENVDKMVVNFNNNFQMNIPGTAIDQIDKTS